ncbi:universal stress protein [Aeromicrobium sp. SMF47]|uniref:Universal stress protein n=1 Tax=Aeromicrobium yanjiei TaxID=2662028 RepID=A0A5Q2MJE4_9ACTN|nr:MULTISPECIES: universal stress protein [Aeromicrobium]MRJ77754.1 universal stress protein [Aeromicrobium yanjiei]MRK02123.1 universal stress protein [Aeromicrobium sp. S22]QGG41152.1 universal stress protein [Aeromicrobium yanjiei]
MPKTILVGVDGSDSARQAAQTAAELAAATGARLHVVTAVDERTRTEDEVVMGDVRLLTPGERAEAIAAEVASSLSGITAEVHVGLAHGKPGDALVQVAKDIGADLIVVGNRRVQGIGRILGSVATDVAHHAPCDVYIVKTV